MRGPWSAALVGIALIVLFGAVSPAAAQVHLLDPAPWSAVADSSSRGGVVMSWDLATGGDWSWRAQRLGLAFHLPVGEAGLAFVRGHLVRLETGRGRIFDRWPDLQAEDLSDADAAAWPGEDQVEDLGQPEIGVLLPAGLPVVGPADIAFMALLPFGKDELYPVASRALVLRLDWRRRALAVGPLALTGRVGWEIALDASGDTYQPTAFPDGLRYGLGLGTPETAPWGAGLSWRVRDLRENHHLSEASMTAWVPLAERHRAQLEVSRNLHGDRDAFATWQVGVAVVLRRPPATEDQQGKMPAGTSQVP